MPKGNHDADKLAVCARAAGQDAAKLKKCLDRFAADGGTSQPVDEGGTFFTDLDGGKVFITEGGKVFG